MTPSRELHCQWCGKKFQPTHYFENWRMQKCNDCAAGNPPRGEPVRYEVPLWIQGALNAAYPEEIKAYFGYRSGFGGRRKLGSRSQVRAFLHRKGKERCQGGVGLFDHFGSDAVGNLITEPYAKNCTGCLATAAELAERLNVKHTVTHPSWHAPWIDECVRITFFKPVVQP